VVGFGEVLAYPEQVGTPAAGEVVWRALRGEERGLSYWAMRRALQRANERLGTNWTLHDLRHTAATRLAGDPQLTLTEVQRVMRHADVSTTGRYTTARLEDMFDRLQEHYARPRPQVSYPAGYDPRDVAVVFGG
jgi:site-specific recombinase XerD